MKLLTLRILLVLCLFYFYTPASATEAEILAELEEINDTIVYFSKTVLGAIIAIPACMAMDRFFR